MNCSTGEWMHEGCCESKMTFLCSTFWIFVVSKETNVGDDPGFAQFMLSSKGNQGKEKGGFTRFGLDEGH